VKSLLPALLLTCLATLLAPAQSAITQNNLLTDGGFDSGAGPWVTVAQGTYFYTAGNDTIASIGYTNGVSIRQDSTNTLDPTADLVLTVRARNGDGHLEGLRLSLLDATTGGTVLTNLDCWFPSSDANLNPGPWRIFALYVDTAMWPSRSGHLLSVYISSLDTSAWSQNGWLHLDWVQLASPVARFTSQPQDASFPASAYAALSATATGAVATNTAGDLSYQWFKTPATPILNATNASLVFPVVTASNAGVYFVLASNAYSWCQSSNATLTVRAAEPAYVDPNFVYVDSFDGWGSSLCWWANVAGGYANRSTYADLAFTQLKLNIVRYNIGGGENPGISNTMEFRAQMPGFEPSPGVWNWAADANQRWMLKAAVARGANKVVAFANAPPWWMTVSASVTGSTNGTSDNLLTAYEDDFAVYLATVMSNLTVLDGVQFDLSTPMNEPNSSWWKLGGRQEGCPMSPAQQARMVNALKPELATRGLSTAIDASEDSYQSQTISSLSAYSATAQSNTTLVATHTYGANNPSGVRNLAHHMDRPLWMSEYGDSDGTGLTMARRIHDDLTGMWCRAWIYWQVVDNAGGWGLLYNPLSASGGTSYTINRKFYVMGQFSQFIRPGCQLIGVGDNNSVAAYTPSNHTLVIVSVNDTTNAFNAVFDLAAFSTLPAAATRTRTSSTENLASLANLSLNGNQLVSYLAPQSVTTLVLTNVTPALPSIRPLAWYRFENNAADASGNGNAGYISNAVSFVTGKLGAQAAQFDGASAFVRIPRVISNHFTIALWLKTTTTGGTGQWWAGKGLLDGEVGGSVDDFGLALVGSKAALGVGNPDTTLSSTTSVNDGQWHHIAATRDAVGGAMQLYVDGTLQASGSGPIGARTAPPYLRIGSIQTGSSAGFLSGTIDDVQLFDRVFSAAEIPVLMNHPPSINSSGNYAVLAGRTLSITNVGSDPDSPAQALSWKLLSPPAGATINTNGVLTWRPMISQAPSTNSIAQLLTDNGTPPMSTTQTVLVMVSTPSSPTLASFPSANGRLSVGVASGDWGPDYILETATNLPATGTWKPLATNLAAVPPFAWTNLPATTSPQNFFRVRLAP
jgi:O-glycosyl hydrolase